MNFWAPLTLSLFVFSGVLSPVQAASVLEKLGAFYFHSAALAKDGRTSCGTCHDPEQSWQDGYERALSGKTVLLRNTPSLLNVHRHNIFFWDGRASTLVEQVAGPLFSRAELNSSDELLLSATRSCPDALAEWTASALPIRVFVQNALAAYIRLIPNGRIRFEEFIHGRGSIKPIEAEGLALFTGRLGCAQCHKLPSLTDNRFHDIGLPRRRLVLQPIVKGEVTTMTLGFDFGRSNVSDNIADSHAFRTPSLYHVVSTAPYMHNGIFNTLSEVLDFYSRKRTQEGKPAISEAEKLALLALFDSFSDFERSPRISPVCKS